MSESAGGAGSGFGRPFPSAVLVTAVGVAAVVALSAWRHTAPPRGHGAPAAPAFLTIGDFAATAPCVAEISPGPSNAARAVFWVGFIRLATGVAVVRQAGWLRVARMGGRCGH